MAERRSLIPEGQASPRGRNSTPPPRPPSRPEASFREHAVSSPPRTRMMDREIVAAVAGDNENPCPKTHVAPSGQEAPPQPQPQPAVNDAATASVRFLHSTQEPAEITEACRRSLLVRFLAVTSADDPRENSNGAPSASASGTWGQTERLRIELRRSVREYGRVDNVTVGELGERDDEPRIALVTFTEAASLVEAESGLQSMKVKAGWDVRKLKESDLKDTRTQFVYQLHQIGVARHESLRKQQPATVYIVLEQGWNLPYMEIGGADPYCICWHEMTKPKTDGTNTAHQKRKSGWRKKAQCAVCPCVDSDGNELMKLRGAQNYIAETRPVMGNHKNPRWQHRAKFDHPGGHALGWLVIEVFDFDYIGTDDPIGRVEIDLASVGRGQISNKWYELGWIPGQVFPAPRGEIKVRLLVSSAQDELHWMIKHNSYDFIALKQEIENCSRPAEIAQLQWYLHEVINEVFSLFEVDSDGTIEPGELSHMMFLLGEELRPDEVGRMFAECKKWCQPIESRTTTLRDQEQHNDNERLSNGLDNNSCCKSKQVLQHLNHLSTTTRTDVVALFRHANDTMPFTSSTVEPELDLGDMRISLEEFMIMFTEYWTRRKYGETKASVMGPYKKGQHNGDAPVEIRDVSSTLIARQYHTEPELSQITFKNPEALNKAKSNAIPPPPWMLELGSGHSPISSQFREPAVFWYYLVRKMEQMMTTKKSSGVDDAALFRSKGVNMKKARGICIRNMESTFSLVWDLLQVVLLVYVCISVPYQTGFDITVTYSSDPTTWWIELFVDMYFLVDIGLNFRTPFIDDQGRTNFKSGPMAVNYMKGWALIDIGSCMSLLQYVFDLFSFGDSDAASKTRVAKTLRLLRLAKLLRIARLKRLLDRMGDDLVAIIAPVGNVVVLLLGTAFSMHLISCFWYMAGMSESIIADGEDLITANATAPSPRLGWTMDPDTWDGLNAEDVPIGVRYLTSLYSIMLGEFRATSLGSSTDPEKGVALVSVIFTGFIYGSVAATLSSIMMMLKAPHAEYNSRMDSLRTWMRSKRLPFAVRKQVEAFYEAKLSTSAKIVVNEGAIIRELQPAPIANELVEIMYAETIERVPIFSRLTEEVVVKLCLALVPIPALENCPVVLQDRVGEEMYIIVRGRCQVWENTRSAAVRAKCRLGEHSFWTTVYDSKENREGALDLHGKISHPEIRHRALREISKQNNGSSAVQGVVMKTREEPEPIQDIREDQEEAFREFFEIPEQERQSLLFVDFDPAMGTFDPDWIGVRDGTRVNIEEVRRGTVLGYLNPGDYFGEACLMEGNVRYDRNVTATTNSELCYLHKDSVVKLSNHHPELAEELKRFTVLRENSERVRRKFNEVDQDGSGTLDRTEMEVLLKSIGTVDDVTIQAEIDSMDWEGDGIVSFDEFNAWWFRHSQNNSRRIRKQWQKASLSTMLSASYTKGRAQLVKLKTQQPSIDVPGMDNRTVGQPKLGTQLHVRGIGKEGWDGTKEGLGAYESEEALRVLFSPFGKFVQATIRHRIDENKRENTSYALVTLGSRDAAEKARMVGVYAGTTKLVINQYDPTTAAGGRGGMRTTVNADTARLKAAAENEQIATANNLKIAEVLKGNTEMKAKVSDLENKMVSIDAKLAKVDEKLERVLAALS